MIICLIFLRNEESRVELTVDGNGDSLAENEAVGTLEGRDLAELVELQVLSGETVSGNSLDELEVKTVLLRNSEQRSGARVALWAWSVTVAQQSVGSERHEPNSCKACRKT